MASPEFTPEELATEEWREIVGFESIYEASNLGRVRRVTATRTHAGDYILSPVVQKTGYARVCLYNKGVRKYLFVHQAVMLAFVDPCPSGCECNHISGIKLNNRIQNLEYVTPNENVQHAKRTGLISKGEKHSAIIRRVAARGDRSGSRLHPESRPWGDRNGARKYPERLTRGDDHWQRKYPERRMRGDKNPSRQHPENLARGSENGFAKLSESQVLEIRQLHSSSSLNQREIAERYNVDPSLISLIILRKAWKHI